MDDAAAVNAVLVPPQLERFRDLCQVEGPIEPRFSGYTKHVLLTADRAFYFPRNHTLVNQLERECDVYATIDHPLVPRLLGRWHDRGISPYPFFAVTRCAGSALARISPEVMPNVAAQLGAALGACHEVGLDRVPRRLWANPWSEPPEAPPTAMDCHSPLRGAGGAERIAAAAAAFIGAGPSLTLLEALKAAEALEPVLAHGDLHEDQLLFDGSGSLTGILDWGFAGVMSPLADFAWTREPVDAEPSYGEMRRHMWNAYAAERSAPLPNWEQVQLAMTAFDIAALAPAANVHYNWSHTTEWKGSRRAAAGDCLRAMLRQRGV